jgi:flagellar protein FlgJ
MNELHSPQAFALATELPSTTATIAPAASELTPAQRTKVEQAAVKFEGLFINEMLKQMRRSTHEIAGEDGVFQSKTHTSMLDFADTLVADAMAGQRAFGIADVIVRQMLPVEPPPEAPVVLKFSGVPVALKPESL